MTQSRILVHGLCFAIFALVPWETHATSCGDMTVLSATLPDGGGKKELVIDSSKLEKTPQWTPGVGEPPLMVGKATAIALSWGKKHFSRFDGVEINRISLADSSCSGEGEKWYYVFEFTPVMAGNRMFGSGNWLAVLMDGSVIETQITK